MGSNIITLTSDFGIGDSFVGVMKGVILSINPNANVIDISHEIEPQNISQAAFILSKAAPYFPGGTVHLVVVDPGVGGTRKPVILKGADRFFVGPNNGVFSAMIDEIDVAIEITNSEHFLKPVSNTFHGRDIFAPVAAQLSRGVPIQDFGDRIEELVKLNMPLPRMTANSTIIGEVIHIDRFGNLITNIRSKDIPKGNITIEINGRYIYSLSTNYLEGDEVLAVIGSDDHLEIAKKNKSAADFLGSACGDAVKIVSGNIKT